MTPLLSRWALAPLLLAAACSGQTLDAGSDTPHGLLPVDERNQVIISNDGCGNWQGLYAVLFSKTGGPTLAGITVNASTYASNLEANITAWRNLVTAARASNLRDIPDPISSISSPLARPADGDIDTTVANGSEGAHLIVDVSSRLGLPNRPVVVVAGGRLTDIADAYLLDPTVKDRVVVVAALGTVTAKGGVMGAPNGELDPWADWIVAQRFRYVQVSTFYDPTTDIPSSRLSSLLKNPLSDFIAAQQPNVTSTLTMADQVSIIAVGLPQFVVERKRVAPDPNGAFDPTAGPALTPDENGQIWLVPRIDSALANAHLWQMLQDPKTFGQ